MPRNASGVYTLPESAFVAGTVIQSAPVNSDLSDIATALTQSLATTGVATMTGPIKAASGSVTAPSITFGSSTGTGFYLSAADEFTWTAAGVAQATFSGTTGVAWSGTHTFSGTVNFNSTVVFNNALSLSNQFTVVTPTEPAETLRISDNDTSEHEIQRYALGSGAGATASRRVVGTGANDVSEIRDYVGTTLSLLLLATGVNPKKQLVMDGGITVLATAGYADFTEIAAPAAPAANVARLYVKDDGAGTTVVAYKDSAGTERILLGPPARAYAEYTTNADLTTAIPYDDTIPQNTEGTQIISQAITLNKANSRVRLTFTGWGHCSTAADDSEIWSAAIFRNGTASALAAAANSHDTNESTGSDDVIINTTITVRYEDAPGTVGPHTYEVNVGPRAGTLRMNGSISTRIFGGVARAILTIEEVYV